jgi:AraC-like DNA-binding protein
MYNLSDRAADYFDEIYRIYNSKTDLNINLLDKSKGMVDIESQHYSGFTIIKSDLQIYENSLHIPVQRETPMLMMHFQLGGGMLFLNDKEYYLPEMHHALDYLPQFKSKVVIEGQKKIQDLVVKINTDFIEKIFSDHSDDLAEAMWKLINRQANGEGAGIKNKMLPQMMMLLRQLLTCPFHGEMGFLYKESIVKMLLVHQLADSGSETQPPIMIPMTNKLGSRDVEVLHEIRNFLKDNFLQPLSIDTISRNFGINTFKLKYGFKKLFGTSVINFVIEKRMDHALELIHDSDKRILDIADELGYQHYPSFSVAFRKKFGCAPSELKRSKLVV